MEEEGFPTVAAVNETSTGLRGSLRLREGFLEEARPVLNHKA